MPVSIPQIHNSLYIRMCSHAFVLFVHNITACNIMNRNRYSILSPSGFEALLLLFLKLCVSTSWRATSWLGKMYPELDRTFDFISYSYIQANLYAHKTESVASSSFERADSTIIFNQVQVKVR